MINDKASYFQHPQALVETKNIGTGTRIWAFAHLLPNVSIGCDCNICDHVFIEDDVSIGNRVTIKCGVQLWAGITVEDDVFIGPNATFSNDIFPRSKLYPKIFAKTIIKEGASIGANATLLPGITIGTKAMIGAGAVVTKDVPSYAIVVGNPGRIIGYTDERHEADKKIKKGEEMQCSILEAKGAKLYEMPVIDDSRGTLSYGEFPTHLPFLPLRYFLVYNVPNLAIRGEHAHKELQQFLICVRGSCSVSLDDGYHQDEVCLNSPNVGLLIPPMVWAAQYAYSSDALLLVYASDTYKADDYIRNYDEFLKTVKSI